MVAGETAILPLLEPRKYRASDLSKFGGISEKSLKSGHQLRNKRPNPDLGFHEAKGSRRQQRQATGHGSRRAPFRKLKWNGLAGFFLAV